MKDEWNGRPQPTFPSLPRNKKTLFINQIGSKISTTAHGVNQHKSINQLNLKTGFYKFAT